MITHLILAQAASAPTSQEFSGFWVVLGFLTLCGANLATIGIFLASSRKQRREVSFSFIPASKVEFDAHVADNKREHENLFSKVGGVERGQSARMDSISAEWRRWVEGMALTMAKEEREGREALHNRINDVLRAVSKLEGKVEALPKK